MRALLLPPLLLSLAWAAPVLAQARPHPALTELVPLTEVFDARRPGLPGFDVAGIRCAALTLAQDRWARVNPFAGSIPPAALAAAEANLASAALDRQQRLRQGAAAARGGVQTDADRLKALYLARFDARARADGHPWRNDSLIARDTTYCEFLNAGR